MQTFEWIDATSVDHATSLLREQHVIAKAGGIDLLDLMKEGIVAPARAVNLKLLDELRGIRSDENSGLVLGALSTLAEITAHPIIVERYGAIAQAAAHAATPQVRNVATLGGNILQRPRCWYFRNAQFHDVRTNVDLQEREHQYHAIFDNAHTAMVHASTPVTALIAYGAVVHLCGPNNRTRSIPLAEFLLQPDIKRQHDANIASDEILTHVSVPATPNGTRSAYHKQTERDSYDWPICDVAVVLQASGSVVKAISIVMGSVGPTPMRAVAAETILRGQTMTEALASEAAIATTREATPFKRNAYKVPVLEAVLRRTLLAAIA